MLWLTVGQGFNVDALLYFAVKPNLGLAKANGFANHKGTIIP
jgi:hypothetical protein